MEECQMKILVTGAGGLLGRELSKHIDFIVPKSAGCDITDERQVARTMKQYDPDIVVHLAAYTDVQKAERERDRCFAVNVTGTANVVKHARRVIYWSTEYAFDGERGDYSESDPTSPVNFYAYSKVRGEEHVMGAGGVIVRTLFKPRPYRHAQVPHDMMTSGRYVDDIVLDYVHALKHADRLPPIIHIGRAPIKLIELAAQTRADVRPIERASLAVRLPRNTTLNLSKWHEFLKETRCFLYFGQRSMNKPNKNYWPFWILAGGGKVPKPSSWRPSLPRMWGLVLPSRPIRVRPRLIYA